MMKSIIAADLFCGAGGTSQGLARACETMGRKPTLIAINHWDIAVETHAANHPWAEHLCAALDNIDPKKVVPKGRLNLLVASPECTHHSLARGGKPCSDQSRASAWMILKWLQELYVENVLIENVQEFTSWGPLGADGRPMKSRRGESFRAFIGALKALGYVVEWRVLCAADFGDATTRERLFIIARRGRRKITWPDETHTQAPKQSRMFGTRLPWRPAREIIDWNIPGQSIFTRKKPLAPATLERIAAGLRKFGGKYAEPFLVILRNHQDGRSLDLPLPTMTTSGANFGLCEPFLLGQQSGASARNVSQPVPTIATEGAISLIEPFIVPFFGERNGQHPRTHSLDEPVPTITSHGAGALVQPFLVAAGGPQGKGRNPQSVEDPLSTVLTENHTALVEPFLLTVSHGDEGPNSRDRRSHSLDKPLNTVTTIRQHALVEPLVVQYNGTADAHPVSEPLGTVTTRDRFGLAEFDGCRFDIRFRMLHWRELSAAHSFPSDYKFAGNREQIVKQIGNSVPTEQAAALCRELVV